MIDTLYIVIVAYLFDKEFDFSLFVRTDDDPNIQSLISER